MSIPLLTQVYDEMRRLAVAGSVVAGGDFRLKRLVPALEQAGAKAPVFAKVASAVQAVVDGDEKTSTTSLLELTTLVNAILYTQGATGAAGTLEPIETTDLGMPTAQAGARVLKPLLEALTTRGSGRLELIMDAYERGAFRDFRLVKPALQALDDPYPGVADLVAEKVLPAYGRAILPELRANFDMKGRGGHPRRLRLMHALDPAGTRELVKQALDSGSKEVRVAAIECLGGDGADLSYLLEQVSAKAQEVREAAYRALVALDDKDAVAALQQAVKGEDLALAAGAIRVSKNAKLLQFIVAEAEQDLGALTKTKDKREAGKRFGRLQSLLSCIAGRADANTETFVGRLFDKRNDLAKIKGDPASGADLNATVVDLMANGSKKLQTTLAEAHAALTADELGMAFRAARHAVVAPMVFEMFSPYLTAKVDEKKKQRDPARSKREALEAALGVGGHYDYEARRAESDPPLDPRWLDVAVTIRHLGLVRTLARPGHAGANAFLTSAFDETLEKSKSLHECYEVLACMVSASHPAATDAFVATFGKHGKQANHVVYWFGRLIPELPKSALPKLEALLPDVPDRGADSLLDGIQQLREKT